MGLTKPNNGESRVAALVEIAILVADRNWR